MPDADQQNHRAALIAAYQGHVRSLNRDLERLTESIQKASEPRMDLRTCQPCYLDAARAVLHDVIWAFPNMGLENLIRLAGEIDQITQDMYLPDIWKST